MNEALKKRAAKAKRKKDAIKSEPEEPRELKGMMRSLDVLDMKELDTITNNSSKVIRELVEKYLKENR